MLLKYLPTQDHIAAASLHLVTRLDADTHVKQAALPCSWQRVDGGLMPLDMPLGSLMSAVNIAKHC